MQYATSQINGVVTNVQSYTQDCIPQLLRFNVRIKDVSPTILETYSPNS